MHGLGQEGTLSIWSDGYASFGRILVGTLKQEPDPYPLRTRHFGFRPLRVDPGFTLIRR